MVNNKKMLCYEFIAEHFNAETDKIYTPKFNFGWGANEGHFLIVRNNTRDEFDTSAIVMECFGNHEYKTPYNDYLVFLLHHVAINYRSDFKRLLEQNPGFSFFFREMRPATFFKILLRAGLISSSEYAARSRRDYSR